MNNLANVPGARAAVNAPDSIDYYTDNYEAFYEALGNYAQYLFFKDQINVVATAPIYRATFRGLTQAQIDMIADLNQYQPPTIGYRFQNTDMWLGLEDDFLLANDPYENAMENYNTQLIEYAKSLYPDAQIQFEPQTDLNAEEEITRSPMMIVDSEEERQEEEERAQMNEMNAIRRLPMNVNLEELFPGSEEMVGVAKRSLRSAKEAAYEETPYPATQNIIAYQVESKNVYDFMQYILWDYLKGVYQEARGMGNGASIILYEMLLEIAGRIEFSLVNEIAPFTSTPVTDVNFKFEQARSEYRLVNSSVYEVGVALSGLAYALIGSHYFQTDAHKLAYFGNWIMYFEVCLETSMRALVGPYQIPSADLLNRLYGAIAVYGSGEYVNARQISQGINVPGGVPEARVSQQPSQYESEPEKKIGQLSVGEYINMSFATFETRQRLYTIMGSETELKLADLREITAGIEQLPVRGMGTMAACMFILENGPEMHNEIMRMVALLSDLLIARRNIKPLRRNAVLNGDRDAVQEFDNEKMRINQQIEKTANESTVALGPRVYGMLGRINITEPTQNAFLERFLRMLAHAMSNLEESPDELRVYGTAPQRRSEAPRTGMGMFGSVFSVDSDDGSLGSNTRRSNLARPTRRTQESMAESLRLNFSRLSQGEFDRRMNEMTNKLQGDIRGILDNSVEDFGTDLSQIEAGDESSFRENTDRTTGQTAEQTRQRDRERLIAAALERFNKAVQEGNYSQSELINAVTERRFSNRPVLDTGNVTPPPPRLGTPPEPNTRASQQTPSTDQRPERGPANQVPPDQTPQNQAAPPQQSQRRGEPPVTGPPSSQRNQPAAGQAPQDQGPRPAQRQRNQPAPDQTPPPRLGTPPEPNTRGTYMSESQPGDLEDRGDEAAPAAQITSLIDLIVETQNNLLEVELTSTTYEFYQHLAFIAPSTQALGINTQDDVDYVKQLFPGMDVPNRRRRMEANREAINKMLDSLSQEYRQNTLTVVNNIRNLGVSPYCQAVLQFTVILASMLESQPYTDALSDAFTEHLKRGQLLYMVILAFQDKYSRHNITREAYESYKLAYTQALTQCGGRDYLPSVDITFEEFQPKVIIYRFKYQPPPDTARDIRVYHLPLSDQFIEPVYEDRSSYEESDDEILWIGIYNTDPTLTQEEREAEMQTIELSDPNAEEQKQAAIQRLRERLGEDPF